MTVANRSALNAAATIPGLTEAFRRSMQPFGFSTFAAGFLPPSKADDVPADHVPRSRFLLLDWPLAWLELYAREGFARDDVLVTEAAQTSAPFTWSELRTRQPQASARIFAAAAEFGWTDGLCVPVHTPNAPPHETFGMVSLAAGRLDVWTTPTRAAIVATCLTAFARARALSQIKSANLAGQLSQREKQALTYVAEGLSDPDIATIMGVSRSTAHFHVEQAKKALGATTRAQAIAIALTNDLL